MTEADKLIKEAWELIVSTRPDTIPYTENVLQKELDFTDNFPTEEIRKLPRKFFYVNGKAISKILVIIITIATLTSSITVYAVVKILKLKIHEKNTDISINSQELQQEVLITERYFPTKLPDNYVELERESTATSGFIHYKNTKDNSDIFFRQQLLGSEGSVDNEKTIENEVVVNGMAAIYFEKHGEKSIIFSNDALEYLFYIDTNAPHMTQKELVEIAESLQKE